jgi:hypothetical protein
MRRLQELDALRGLMLVWMTLTHLPTVLTTYVNQPFGFISASEGFIFLSALFTGRIYFRLAQRDGHSVMEKKLGRRTLRLYLYHAVLLSLVFLMAVPITASGKHPGLHNLLDFFFSAGPVRAAMDAALLVYRPPLLDILPMYIIFLVLTPLALRMGQKLGWTVTLSSGLAIWLMAQLGLRQTAWHLLNRHFGLRIPLNEMGSFDPWAWQLVWLVGLWMGVCWAKDELPLTRVARKVASPALIVVLALLTMRYAIFRGFDLGSYAIYVDKWHLGVVRLINFSALGVLLICARSYLKPLSIRPLVLLGQSSLQVFCTHLVFCFAGITLLGDASMLSGWKQFGLVVTALLAMLLTAKLFARTELTAQVRSSRASQKLNRRPRELAFFRPFGAR